MPLQPPTPQASAAAKAAAMAAGRRRRGVFLENMRETGNIHDAAAAAGVALSTYHKWRIRYDDFAAQVDALRDSVTDNPTRRTTWKGSFKDFAWEFFGHDLAWFHLLAAESYETAEGGDVVMFLWPPEHGKTTMAEDFDNKKLAEDPTFRITVGAESKDVAEKILGRVRGRMEADGSAPKYVRRFGPFAPVAGRGRVGKQPWAADHFNVFRKGNHDERDYNMQALGVKGSILNTRCDLLQLDDMQSSRTANRANTEALLNVVRGDWLSRPGVKGHTVINASRQGPEDILGELLNQGIIDRLIKLPAYDESRIEEHGTPWLWPQRYSERDYERLKRNAGPERWDLTYLQKEGSTAKATFREEHWGPCRNNLRSVIHDPPRNKEPETRIQKIAVGLDPAIGSPNGLLAAAFSYRKMYVLTCASVPDLTNNDQVLGLVEELCHQFELPADGLQVTDVIIESKAYQKALMDDRQLHKMIERFGFNAHPHDTGLNKYDENLGVPQMVHSMLRQEIDFPYADAASRGEMDGLFGELGSWRPHVAGKRLRMDRVMALWFVWMFWRNIRNSLKPNELPDGKGEFDSAGLPYGFTSYQPGRSGLYVPAGR